MAPGGASVPLPQLVGDQACTHTSKTASQCHALWARETHSWIRKDLRNLSNSSIRQAGPQRDPSFLLLSRCLRIPQAFSRVLEVQTIETTTHSLGARGPLLPLLFYQLWSLCLNPQGYSEVTPTKARSQRGHPVL